jgi:phenylalanyl-tRNA synthetase alpha chain
MIESQKITDIVAQISIINPKIKDVDIESIISKLKSENTTQVDIIHKIKPDLLGSDGIVTKMMSMIQEIDPSKKKEYGSLINNLKQILSSLVSSRLDEIKIAEINKRMESEKIDGTIPTKILKHGRMHVISKVAYDLVNILRKYGFSFVDGPEIETDFFNFVALNVPAHHPARQMQDTVYIDEKMSHLLRTQTSSVQIRHMIENKPPIRIASFGKVYRRDDIDATHSPMFHQLECLAIDENASMANLKGLLRDVFSDFFQEEINIRLRPSFFPFTEPSAEVDISYIKTEDAIKPAKSDKYMELLGCGMVHTNVLKTCNIDSEKYQGFAFGMGIERIAMLKYGISDIRSFYSNNDRFNEHYNIEAHNI